MAEMTREWLGKSVLKRSPLRHFLLQPPELQINHLTHDVKIHITQLNDQQQQLRPRAHCLCSLCSVGFQFEETLMIEQNKKPQQVLFVSPWKLSHYLRQ